MGQPNSLTRTDLSVLLRIVGSRQGADLDAIVDFESSHHRQHRTPDQIRESLARLMGAALVVQQGNQYFGAPEVQAAFFDECRNCSDTIEEFDVLNRIIAQFGKFDEPQRDGMSETGQSTRRDQPGSRWRGT